MCRNRSLPRAIFAAGRSSRRLIGDARGTSAVEFALLAIPLFTFLLGVVEFGRLYWTQSELQYAAEAAARCATVNCCTANSAPCGGQTGNTGVQNFAANQLLGQSISSNELNNFSLTSQSCGNQVSFTYTFNFVVGPLIPNSAITLSGSACNQG